MSHYFTNDRSIKTEVKEHQVFINQQNYQFLTDHGVFSKKGLDFGTRTLLELLEINKIHGRVLDFGCGYGPIGIYIKKNRPMCDVMMIDVNDRVLDLARKNALLNNVDVTILKSDQYENINQKFDFIVTNPPIRVGKEILYNILFGAKEYLNPGGELWLVVSKDQGAKSLIRDLEESYEVKVIGKNKGFYIICGICN